MSNRRKPQHRDAHGAPIRTRREIWIAVATGLAVLTVSIVLIVVFRHRPPEAVTIPAPVTTSGPAIATFMGGTRQAEGDDRTKLELFPPNA